MRKTDGGKARAKKVGVDVSLGDPNAVKGFTCHGVVVNPGMVRICIDYLKFNPTPTGDIDWAIIRIIAMGNGPSLENQFSNIQVGEALDKCIDDAVKSSRVRTRDITEHVSTVDKLVDVSNDDKKRKAENLIDYEMEDNDDEEEGSVTAAGSDFDYDDDEDDDIPIPVTPSTSRTKTPLTTPKRKKLTSSITRPPPDICDAESDENMDAPTEDTVSAYNTDGEIDPKIARLVIKTAGRTHYGKNNDVF